MSEDKSTIRIVIIVLLLLTILIYFLAFKTQTQQITSAIQINAPQNITQPINSSPTNTIIQNTNNPIIIPKTSDNTTTQQIPSQSIPTNTNAIVAGRGITKIDNQTIQTQTVNNTAQISLPNTQGYIGGLASIQTLAINPEYIFKDNTKQIYYMRIDQQYDRATIAQRYNGNTKQLITQTEIQLNQLFGTQIIYINLPQYAGQIVLMVVEINNQTRLLQIDYAIYHQSKAYLKQQFAG